MFLVLPAAMVLGRRLGMLRGQPPLVGRWGLVPSGWPTAVLAAMVLAAVVLARSRLEFDYDFSSLKAEVRTAGEVRLRHAQVYQGFSAPGAIYVVRDLETLDKAVKVLERARDARGESPIVSKISSVRNFVPEASEMIQRRGLLADIQDRLQGRWIRRVKDEQRKRWIEDIRDFSQPSTSPTLEDLPPEMRQSLIARDGSGALLLAVDTPGRSKDGRTSMAFAAELYGLKMPEGVRGPTGERLVLAEILWLVTNEGPWLVGLTFLGICVLVLLDRRGSLAETFWILLPLASGVILTLGAMPVLGWKLNFFNMVVLPSLIGMSVDSGVHYYRRWQELGHDTEAAQQELLEPLTGSALTTVMGYAGMVFANHQGLRSIGNLAMLGLTCCWVTSVVLMPGILRLRERRLRRKRAEALEQAPA
jgi:hypothetical protein